MNLDPLNIGAILIAVIAALTSWATQRSSAKTAILNEKAKAEAEAYGRAVKMDSDTIARQDKEILELREDKDALTKRVRELEKDNGEQHTELIMLRRRVFILEKKEEQREQ
jgi:hypothetical protein